MYQVPTEGAVCQGAWRSCCKALSRRPSNAASSSCCLTLERTAARRSCGLTLRRASWRRPSSAASIKVCATRLLMPNSTSFAGQIFASTLSSSPLSAAWAKRCAVRFCTSANVSFRGDARPALSSCRTFCSWPLSAASSNNLAALSLEDKPEDLSFFTSWTARCRAPLSAASSKSWAAFRRMPSLACRSFSIFRSETTRSKEPSNAASSRDSRAASRIFATSS
mmetsp:Transcript_116879/g.277660  ORF Transcript_116879/g.277660 Transcript_116879/m.277660 type:complete len:223 (-) Transcript_116879:790-1458(-)